MKLLDHKDFTLQIILYYKAETWKTTSLQGGEGRILAEFMQFKLHREKKKIKKRANAQEIVQTEAFKNARLNPTTIMSVN